MCICPIVAGKYYFLEMVHHLCTIHTKISDEVAIKKNNFMVGILYNMRNCIEELQR